MNQSNPDTINMTEILLWGYETGGELDEAVRIWAERKADDGMHVSHLLTDAFMEKLEQAFKHEFGN